MLFVDKIRQLREEKQLLQRQVSAFLEMDNALYCKIERGDRPVKREQVKLLAKLFNFDESELLKLWLADKVYEIVGQEKDANGILNVVQDNIVEYKKNKYYE